MENRRKQSAHFFLEPSILLTELERVVRINVNFLEINGFISSIKMRVLGNFHFAISCVPKLCVPQIPTPPISSERFEK